MNYLISHPVKWNERKTLSLLDSCWDSNFIRPNISIPIPINAIDKAKEVLNEHDFNLYGFRILYYYSLKHITDHFYTPFGAFIFWDQTVEIRKIVGRGRAIWTKLSKVLFDYQNHSEGNFPKSYRYKPEFLSGDYLLVESEIKINKPLSQLSYNEKGLDSSFNESISFLLNLDFSEVNLFNGSLLDDFYSAAKSSITESLIYDRRKTTITINRFVLSNKMKFKMKPLNLYSGSFSNYKDLETELKFQRKKYLINQYGKSLYITRDDVTNRLHHNLTMLPSQALKYLSIDGERLKEIDMNNCHYTLFANILCGYRKHEFESFLNQSNTYISFISSFGGEINLNKKIEFFLRKAHRITAPSPLIMLAHYIKADIGEYFDLFLFIVASMKGMLYEVVGLYLYGEDYTPIKRNEVKSILMSVFYSGYNDMTNHCYAFKGSFKNVFDLITDLKATLYRSFESGWVHQNKLFNGCINSQNKKDKNNYDAGNSCFPILLMNVESNIFVDNLLSAINTKKIKSISKHDSILVKLSDYSDSIFSVQKALNKELGVARYSL